jgi:hypothetical protein
VYPAARSSEWRAGKIFCATACDGRITCSCGMSVISRSLFGLQLYFTKRYEKACQTARSAVGVLARGQNPWTGRGVQLNGIILTQGEASRVNGSLPIRFRKWADPKKAAGILMPPPLGWTPAR